jgi:hypothetical protein
VFAVVGVLLLLLGLLMLPAATGKGALLAKKLAIPLIVLAALVGRALWVRLPAPDGMPLKRRDHPLLFDTLHDLRRRLRGSRIHQVLLCGDFNAAVAQVPHLGLFGWQKNYLILGMPAHAGAVIGAVHCRARARIWGSTVCVSAGSS